MKSCILVCITGSAGSAKQKLPDRGHVNSGIQVDLILIVEVQLISMQFDLRYWRRITGQRLCQIPEGHVTRWTVLQACCPWDLQLLLRNYLQSFLKCLLQVSMDLGAGKAITFWWNSMKCFSDGFLISNDSLLAKICFKPSHKLRCMNMNRNKQTSVQPCGFSLP